jgi:hypothetical protein
VEVASRAFLFEELAPLLRYHHMTSDFLATVVIECPLMKASGLLHWVVRSGFAQRDVSPAILQQARVLRGKLNRGVSLSAARWELQASFTLEEVAALEPGSGITKWCGLVAGYGAGLNVERVKEKDALGAYLRIHVPSDLESPLAVYTFSGPTAGVGLQAEITLSPDVKREFSAYFTANGRGYHNIFGKPWAEAVCEGSPHFPGGKLEFTATVMLLTTK